LVYAYGQTTPGGEINLLDAAGFGPLTITNSISIIGNGTAGVLVPSGGTGITISAGPNDVINIRGLIIEGAGVGETGIQFNSGASLTIENSVIRHVTSRGIKFFPIAASNLLVSNTLVADNGQEGIYVASTGAGSIVTAVFNRVEVNNNGGHGIIVDGSNNPGTVNATVSDSVAARNSAVGFFAYSTTGQAPATLVLFHSVAANNFYGIGANGVGATLRAAQSVVTGNTVGRSATTSGVVASYGNNYIDGNGSDVGVLTPVAKQ
jgi:hypothetical protein